MPTELSSNLVRRILREKLFVDSTLEAFCIDYLPEAKQQFSMGMTREERENIILTKYNVQVILEQIEQWQTDNNIPMVSLVLNNKYKELSETKINADLRAWLVKASLLAVTANLAFFAISPVIGFPIEYKQSLHLAQIVLPVFLGYLGTAAVSLIDINSIKLRSHASEQDGSLIKILTIGPIISFLIVSIASIAGFWISNSDVASAGIGMTTNMLAMLMSISISILNVSTNVIMYYLFAAAKGTH